MTTPIMASAIIEKERQKLVKILQQDPDSLLDTLASQSLISEEEYEILETVTDPLKKSRKMLILIQKKGEKSCQQFLECLHSAFPNSATSWWSVLEFVKQEKAETTIFMEENKNSKVTLLSENKQCKNADVFMYLEEESQDLKPTGPLGNKGVSNSAVILFSREEEEEGDELEDTVYSEDEESYENPEAVVYSGEEWEGESPDADLYLREMDNLEPVAYVEDPESAEEEACVDVEYTEYCGENDMIGYLDDEQRYENLETEVSVEEEDAADLEERRKTFKEILSCLAMDRNKKLLPSFVHQFHLDHGCHWIPQTSADLAWNFLVKIQSLDVTARDTVLSQRVTDEDSKDGLITKVENMGLRDKETIDPLDVLCAIMLCSDTSLQQEVLGNMFKCHFALPLLLPDAENSKCILMLGAMKNIVPKDSIHYLGGAAQVGVESLVFMKMPLISFVRLGCCGSSKSKILNAVLSPPQKQPLHIFLHRDSHASLFPRQISDGMVEITWYFPNSGGGKETPDIFQEPVAVANLRGDLELFWTQFGFLMEVSSAMFIFIDCPGEREWDLLAFLGKSVKERCYFILSPQSKESEEAQLFQRVLKLKPSQLLLLEESDREDRGRSAEGLQIALKEVMRSPLRHVSVEDMASLARELGIQVDQDCEKAHGVQGTLSEATTEAGEDEVLQSHTYATHLPGSQCQMAARETRIFRGVHPQPHAFYHTPSFTSGPWAWRHPLTIMKGNLYQARLRPNWAMGSNVWPGVRPRWLNPLAFHNRRANTQGRSPGRGACKPQRIHQAAPLVKSSRSPPVQYLVRPPRLISQTVQASYQGSQSKSLGPSRFTSQAGQLQTLGPQPSGTSILPIRPNFHSGWFWNPRFQHVGVTKEPMRQASSSRQYQTAEAQSTETCRRPASQSQGLKLGRTSGTQRSQPSEAAGQPVKLSCHKGSTVPHAPQPARTGRPLRSACQPGANKQYQGQYTKPASQTGHSSNYNNKPSPKSHSKPPQNKPSTSTGGAKRRGK
ncbi:caspase recruitment domain-containing protein 6 [Vombatus ursinus]|uniref:CARD domain-containing protein n=1 Tax=Vombatus ursinus TaxID=29139 RepID=A0A4X2JRD3_VOMUR|nr:caspase recruitment domain-containing protein 6 [Vombatus ursinus]XP_027719256.1 caspase recruitment domain-containing protein 6 [Vombatus ursinus]